MDTHTRWLFESTGFEIRNSNLLAQALTHRSAASRNNERLEFLGDAVLDSVISEIVFAARPDADEGSLSRYRAALVREGTLAEIATQLNLGDHLVLGSGEKKSGGFRRASILADALEAVFGAVYVDAGYAAAGRVIRAVYGNRVIELPDPESLKDPKTRLQELLQADGHSLPVYATERVTGKAHNQRFDVSCSLAALGKSARGEGSSRREAEQAAANNLLHDSEQAMNVDADHRKRFRSGGRSAERGEIYADQRDCRPQSVDSDPEAADYSTPDSGGAVHTAASDHLRRYSRPSP